MARDAQTKIINGHEWQVYPWDAMHGLRMQARLAPLMKAAVAGAHGGDVLDMDVSAVLNGVFDQIDDQRTPQLIRDMLHGVRVDGQDVSMDRPFNDLFAANYAELYQGLWFVINVNLGDLFQMAGDIGSLDAPAADQEANSPES